MHDATGPRTGRCTGTRTRDQETGCSMTKPETLTIGAFAKASRLSPKALRLYDELDLLRPARVDPDTGYRYYAPEQLEQARLVAWLRRLGMPLARIQSVCAPEPSAAVPGVPPDGAEAA